jgi:hypothetical protein
MKAQAALLEILLSYAILASLSGLAVNLLYASPAAQRSYDFGIGNALYDFGNMLYRNATAKDCFIDADQKCELGIARNLSTAFSLKYVQLSDAGVTVESGSERYCAASQERCYPIPRNGTYHLLCLYVCD